MRLIFFPIHRLQRALMRSWWVIGVILLGLILYEQGLKKRDRLYQQLSGQLTALQKEKQKALHEFENLNSQINGQHDSSWIEFILIEELGVVPQGQQKIYFYPEYP